MIGNLSAKDVLLKFYDEDSDLFKLLWHHSCQVAEMALDIAARFAEADQEFVYDASLLHDVGIYVCRRNALRRRLCGQTHLRYRQSFLYSGKAVPFSLGIRLSAHAQRTVDGDGNGGTFTFTQQGKGAHCYGHGGQGGGSGDF